MDFAAFVNRAIAWESQELETGTSPQNAAIKLATEALDNRVLALFPSDKPAISVRDLLRRVKQTFFDRMLKKGFSDLHIEPVSKSTDPLTAVMEFNSIMSFFPSTTVAKAKASFIEYVRNKGQTLALRTFLRMQALQNGHVSYRELTDYFRTAEEDEEEEEETRKRRKTIPTEANQVVLSEGGGQPQSRKKCSTCSTTFRPVQPNHIKCPTCFKRDGNTCRGCTARYLGPRTVHDAGCTASRGRVAVRKTTEEEDA